MMKVDLTKVTDRNLGEVLDVFYVCQKCRVVDNDHNRLEKWYECTSCGEPGDVAYSYYSTQVFSLITLMQEAYHAQENEHGKKPVQWGVNKAKLPVIIFFTTLRELLLNNLINELFVARDIEPDICDRLLKDSPTHKQRLNKLFRTLTGEKWEAALRAIDQKEKTDFLRLNRFMVGVVDARNDFVHAGNTWDIEDKMVDECISALYDMLQLHTYLHNYFVAPLYAWKLSAEQEEKVRP